MLRQQSLSEIQCRYAMSHGEFGEEVIASSRHVAVILTQSWCPDWKWMKGWVDRQAQQGQPEGTDIDVWQLEYNRVPFFDDFRTFKERTFNNYQIPYVRYYTDGAFSGDSNQVSFQEFYARFKEESLSE